jgi:hypothetical protein
VFWVCVACVVCQGCCHVLFVWGCAFYSHTCVPIAPPCRLSGFLKTQALGKKGGLPLMRHERWILDGDVCSGDCEVPDAAISQMKAARSCAEEVLNDQDLACFADIQKVMSSNSTLLLAMDRTFVLELSWLEQHGEQAMQDAMRRRILQCLPSAMVNITLAQCAMKLDELLHSEMGKFSSLRCQGELKSIKKQVAHMAQGMSPKLGFDAGGGIFDKVFKAMPFFLRALPDNSMSTCLTMLCGFFVF